MLWVCWRWIDWVLYEAHLLDSAIVWLSLDQLTAFKEFKNIIIAKFKRNGDYEIHLDTLWHPKCPSVWLKIRFHRYVGFIATKFVPFGSNISYWRQSHPSSKKTSSKMFSLTIVELTKNCNFIFLFYSVLIFLKIKK